MRAMLGVGLLLGPARLHRWGLEELGYFWITINRDGLYYETSLSYSEFSRSVFLDMIELATTTIRLTTVQRRMPSFRSAVSSLWPTSTTIPARATSFTDTENGLMPVGSDRRSATPPCRAVG